MITVRREQTQDIAAVHYVNQHAFGREEEARLVDRLRQECASCVSLVAAEGDRVVGHILFTPVVIETEGGPPLEGMGLGPMAVAPELQRSGIGTQLVEAGLEILRAQNCPLVIVLGHPEYYPRFGFAPASNHALRCQWEGVPEEAFMAMVLDPGALEGISGVARYRDEFNEAM